MLEQLKLDEESVSEMVNVDVAVEQDADGESVLVLRIADREEGACPVTDGGNGKSRLIAKQGGARPRTIGRLPDGRGVWVQCLCGVYREAKAPRRSGNGGTSAEVAALRDQVSALVAALNGKQAAPVAPVAPATPAESEPPALPSTARTPEAQAVIRARERAQKRDAEKAAVTPPAAAPAKPARPRGRRLSLVK